jgi:hypothetical protein
MKVFEKSGEPFNTLLLFWCLTNDIITTYAFGESNSYPDVPDFNAPLFDTFRDLLKMIHLTDHFDFILPMIDSLPDWIKNAMSTGPMVIFQNVSPANSQSPKLMLVIRKQNLKSTPSLKTSVNKERVFVPYFEISYAIVVFHLKRRIPDGFGRLLRYSMWRGVRPQHGL